jgi:hypothetical protein
MAMAYEDHAVGRDIVARYRVRSPFLLKSVIADKFPDLMTA